MTETNAPSPRPPTTARRISRSALPWLGLAGFLVLGGAIAYVGLRPGPPAPPVPDLAPLTHRMSDLATALDHVETGQGALQAKLASVEQKLASARPRAPDLSPIENRLGALEKRTTALAASVARASATNQRPAASDSGPNADALTAALAPLSARLALLEKTEAGAAKTDAGRAAAEARQEKALAALEASTTALTHSEAALSKRLDALTHLAERTAAAAALRDGRPLGAIPGAPPELARYASTPPPTLSSLRGTFAAAAHDELALGHSADGRQGFMGEMRSRLGSLITVREGDRVILGNPAAGVIAKARSALEAGDLEGALEALGALKPPLAPAMASWIGQARNLLAAEAALASFGAPS